eukprot:2845833-Rhodomonas_salina.1
MAPRHPHQASIRGGSASIHGSSASVYGGDAAISEGCAAIYGCRPGPSSGSLRCWRRRSTPQ